MSIENRSQYCVFYPGPEGELFIRENIGVDDLAKIYKEALAFSNAFLIMSGRSVRMKLSNVFSRKAGVI
jgi:hypothetical protein